MRWVGHVAYYRRQKRIHHGQKPLGRPWHRQKDNIKMDLQDVGCKGMDWIGLTEDRDK